MYASLDAYMSETGSTSPEEREEAGFTRGREQRRRGRLATMSTSSVRLFFNPNDFGCVCVNFAITVGLLALDTVGVNMKTAAGVCQICWNLPVVEGTLEFECWR